MLFGFEHKQLHPASRASSCLFLYWGGEKEALPESRQLFEAAAARTSGLVNLVFSRQTGFSSASIRLVIKPMLIIEPAVPWQIKMAARSARRARSQTPVILDEILLTVNSCHAWPVFLKFERRFEIYMSVLNIANEVSKFPNRVSLFYWRYKALNFSLHYNIKYFKNNNCFPSILNLLFFCCKCVFFGKISREMFNIPFPCRTVQREIRMFISFSEILVTRDVNWL